MVNIIITKSVLNFEMRGKKLKKMCMYMKQTTTIIILTTKNLMFVSAAVHSHSL